MVQHEKMTDKKLRTHDVTLRGPRVVLRPMTEGDWDLLHRWGSDPEVLWLSEGDDVASYTREEVQGIYRHVSQQAFCFIIEVNGEAIGECWLQEMNLERILLRFPEKDSRRIDLTIGEKDVWGQGYGTETIGLLTEFGFQRERADYILGCGIADYNPRSLKAFMNNGYSIDVKVELPAGNKAKYEQDVMISRQE